MPGSPDLGRPSLHDASWTSLLGTILTLGIALPAPAQDDGVVQGRVLTDDGRPVTGASVRMGDSARTLTGPGGDFAFEGVAAGVHTLRVRYLGFETARRRVRLETGAVRRIRITLRAEAIEVAELVVEVPRRRRTWIRGMFEGLVRGHGHLLTRAEISERAPFRTSDLLRRMPGFQVRGPAEHGIGNRVLVRCGGDLREATVYLDGGMMPDLDLDAVPPEHIAALGVVRGPSVSALTPGCGAVVIVTRAMAG